MGLKPGETLGEAIPSAAPVPRAVWRKVLDSTGRPTGEAVLDRFLPLGDVLASLTQHVLPEATKQGIHVETLRVFPGSEHLVWPDQAGDTACYAVSCQANEGAAVHVDLLSGGRIHSLFYGRVDSLKAGFALALLIAEALGA